MKNRIIELIAFMLGLLTTVAGILTLPQVAMLPKEWQPFIGLSLALVIVGKNGFYVVMDFLDDGQLNQSYKLPKNVPLWLLCGLALMLVSCAGMTKEQWMVIGKGVLLREAPILYGEIQQARAKAQAREVTSGKEPVGEVNP